MKYAFQDPTTSVFFDVCRTYDPQRVAELIKKQFVSMLGEGMPLQGKTVVIKPNFVAKAAPERGITTHPTLITGAADAAYALGAKAVKLAESSGGPYTVASLQGLYRECGIASCAQEHRIELNYDVSFCLTDAPEGRKSKTFQTLTPISEADVIINIAKLKSHSLTRMSAAVKNLFGTIPGLQKFEMHARFSDYEDFHGALVDLCDVLHRNHLMINLLDAVEGMEGNGPTGGDKREIGCILGSLNPYNLDTVAAALIDCEGEVGFLQEAHSRGFCMEKAKDISVAGDYTSLILSDFKVPDSGGGALGWFQRVFDGRFAKLFQPTPKIDRHLCKGCGICAKSCPKKTIVMKQEKGKPIAEIQKEQCIRCYCCQEFCPHKAVKIKRNWLLRLIH